MPSLYVIRGKDNGQHFAIRGNQVSIGRESSNHIKLRDSEASRQHATIVCLPDGQFEIRDNHSSNGTFVNSRRIERQLLTTGDRVQIGRSLMIFTANREPENSERSDVDSSQNVEIVTGEPESELSHIVGRVGGDITAFLSHGQLVRSDARQSPPTDDSSRSIDQPEEKTAAANWEIVYQVGLAISRTVDLDHLLPHVLDLIFGWIECDRGCLMLLDDVTGLLTPVCSRSRNLKSKETAEPSPSNNRRLAISKTILDYVVSNREGVLISNAQQDQRWLSESVAALRVNEAICVPMMGRYGLVGALYIDTEMSTDKYLSRSGKSCFDESHLKLMVAVASQAALAIEDTQFYRAMLQSERLATMGQTIANLSHHIKNILQGISGGSYLIDDGLKRENLEVVRKGWSIVEKNQDRISNLVMDMLTFSKERAPELRPGNVNELVSDVVELMQARAANEQVALKLQLQQAPLEAMFDGEAMHRALLNVVTNAIDAARDAHAESDPKAANVTFATELRNDAQTVCIHVTDNGGGIDESDFARIFSPFESDKASRGTGLGLPVSQKILREHGGDISLKSELSHGTTFTLYWPVGNLADSAALTQQL